ncbi:hypothetical protein B0H14DRAFT_3449995 [Mycena olivaceomarginata]|nr:hypothetical protein B0H14DRAFT_3449995 [Mycena olivaceomarginata]
MMGGALPPNDDIVDLCPDLRHSPGPDAGLKGLLQCLPDTPQGEQLSSITRAAAGGGYDMPDGTASDKEDPDTLATECPEEHSPSVITADEKKKLQEDSEVVEALEKIYSLTPHLKRSVLTPEESWRFRRAMYRIMFYTKLFPCDRYSFKDFVDLGDDVIKLIQRQRTAVLKEYPTDELRQMYAVIQFLRGILEDVAEAENDIAIESSMVDILLSRGPESVWCTWHERSFEPVESGLPYGLDENELHTGYFSLPLNKIWTARGVKPPKDDDDKEPPTKWILDLIIGGNDTCDGIIIRWAGSQCATPGGLKLLTEANWHRIDVNPVMFLKNRLKHNSTVQTPFQAALASFRQ